MPQMFGPKENSKQFHETGLGRNMEHARNRGQKEDLSGLPLETGASLQPIESAQSDPCKDSDGMQAAVVAGASDSSCSCRLGGTRVRFFCTQHLVFWAA